jgi:hypothetical protein
MKQELNGKKCLTQKQQLDHWTQQYLQAKTNGDTRLLRIYEALILKLGGKIPKI